VASEHHGTANQARAQTGERIFTRFLLLRAKLIAPRETATTGEATIVLGLPVAVFLARPVASLIMSTDVDWFITDRRLLTTLAYEVVLAAALGWWLSRRGWRLLDDIRAPERSDLLRGPALWFATWVIGVAVIRLLAAAVPSLEALRVDVPLRGTLSVWTLAAALLINPVFEEILWLGYAIPTIARRYGLPTAAVISVALRVAVHLNQGIHALTAVLPVALVFTAYFIYTRRLAPVVLAHIIINVWGLGHFVEGGRET